MKRLAFEEFAKQFGKQGSEEMRMYFEAGWDSKIEVRRLTEQERKHYKYCPCCGQKVKPMTPEECATNVVLSFKMGQGELSAEEIERLEQHERDLGKF